MSKVVKIVGRAQTDKGTWYIKDGNQNGKKTFQGKLPNGKKVFVEPDVYEIEVEMDEKGGYNTITKVIKILSRKDAKPKWTGNSSKGYTGGDAVKTAEEKKMWEDKEKRALLSYQINNAGSTGICKTSADIIAVATEFYKFITAKIPFEVVKETPEGVDEPAVKTKDADEPTDEPIVQSEGADVDIPF